MKTTLLIAALLLLQACSHPGNQSPLPPQGGQVHGQGGPDSSPILIADGSSVHFRNRASFITPVGKMKAQARLVDASGKLYVVTGFSVVGCPPANCQGPTMLKGKGWTLEIDSGGSVVNNLSLDYRTPNQIDFAVPAGIAGFQIDEDDGSNGPGLFQKTGILGIGDYHLNSSKLTITYDATKMCDSNHPGNCPSIHYTCPTKKGCQMAITLCQSGSPGC